MNEYIFNEVKQERLRQDLKYGNQPQNWKSTAYLAILGEEFGEVAKAIVERNKEMYRKELIQLAAVAVAAIEDLDNGEPLKSLD